MTLHRVRTLIPHLIYADLKKKKAVPAKALFTGIKKGGVFPPIAKKMGYAQFGMFIDYYIRSILAKRFSVPFEFSKHTRYELYKSCNERFFQNELIPEEPFRKCKDYFKALVQFITLSFSTEEVKSVELEPIWNFEQIQGHPDLVIDDTIYDIKTTGQFNSMRIETVFQLLSYFCLAQHLGKKHITHIGVLLPGQELILRADISKSFNWKLFWTELTSCITTLTLLKPKVSDMLAFQVAIIPFVGSHVNRESTTYSTLSALSSRIPWQIFLAGRCSVNFKISDADIEKTRALTKHGHRFYIHAPYTLNLSRRYEDEWVIKSLKKHLKTCVKMGGKGVVIHCGVKAKDVDYHVAYKNMLDSVSIIARKGTPECPLIIETSAKETGELLSDPEGLIGFYHSLPDDVRGNVAVCVDTCHVFSAGYIPMDFVRELETGKVPIALFHFNDSKGGRGCCKDRHASIGKGYIGLDALIKVGAYAIQNKIDLVHE